MAESTNRVKKYGLNMLVTSDDQVKAYIKRIMAQLSKWMTGGKISKLVVVITSKETGEHVERWQFDVSCTNQRTWVVKAHEPMKVQIFNNHSKSSSTKKPVDKENDNPAAYAPSHAVAKSALTSNSIPTAPSQVTEEKTEIQIQSEIQAIFRQITASVTFLPELDGSCTFNVLVYADANSEVPLEWGDSDAKEIEGGERVQLRSFSTSSHRVDTLVSYRCV